jgi:glyceraldehyde-3-phosphate dehydrogenase (NADP+)
LTVTPSKFLIDGTWRSSATTRPVVNPFSKTVVGEVYQATDADIMESIGAAEEAFAKTRRLTSDTKRKILLNIAGLIERNREDLARLITTETGKPIALSRVEVARCIFTFTVSAEEAGRIEGTVLPLDVIPGAGNRTAIVRRFPLGPISAITPFNFPLNLVAHKVGPAIAAGDSIVLKPSSSAPLVALRLGEIVEEAGFLKGALNIVPCVADKASQLIIDERVKLVTFTGSPAIGWGLKARAGKKRVVLELGGNAGVVVDATANVQFALDRLVSGSFGNAGQSCIAVQRIFVHESIYAEFLDRFLRMTGEVVTGDPFNEKTLVGPMITEEAAQKVELWIAEAVALGARVLCGGTRRGALMEPTILVDVSPKMSVCSQEVFAPVVTLEKFADFTDAVRKVNDSAFGLQAGVFSNDLKNIFFAYEELQVGGVIVNDSSAFRIDHMPYGGVKDSGFGREGIRYAIEEMTEMKLLGLNPGL